jgi:cation diffusion facilitator family transporter
MPVEDSRGRSTQHAALWAIASNTSISSICILMGLVSHSVAVLGEGLHNLIDIVSSFLTFLAVRRSSLPPDPAHPFGYGKYEALSSSIEGSLVLLAAFTIARSAIMALRTGAAPLIDGGVAAAAMVVCALIGVICSFKVRSAAHKHDSLALYSSGVHLAADVWVLAGLFTALGIMWVLRQAGINAPFIDPCCALLIAAHLTREGIGVIRRALDQLTDRALPPEEVSTICKVVESRGLSCHNLRTRKAGNQRQVDLHLVIPNESLYEAEETVESIEEEIRKLYKGAVVIIQTEVKES